MEKDQLFNFRQPMVTAAGIILGFILSFTTELVKSDRKSEFFPMIILCCMLIGIILLVVSLYRILNIRYNRDEAEKYYKKTLGFFLAGIIFSFAGGLLRMFQSLFLS